MRAYRLLVAMAAATLFVGCSSAPSSSGGFVGGDGSITVLAIADRPEAPAIEGTTLDGATWRSADVSGKVIVYNVWGSWCSPCRAEAPALAAASKQLAGQAIFVGLNTRDIDMAAPKAFVRAFEVPYANLFDPDGALLLKFSGQLPASPIPSTRVVNADGGVPARIIGETTQATLVGLVEDVAAGK